MANQDIVIFGEVLWDAFPNGHKILGGAPFNVAWHLKAFGANPLLISRVGNDELGQQIKAEMSAWNLSTSGLQTDPENPTGIVSIQLKNGQPNYEIKSGCAYDFIDQSLLPALPTDFLFYHGTLAARHSISAQSINSIKKMASLTFFDVNLRSPWWDLSTIQKQLQQTQWLKLNDEELPLIAPHNNSFEDKISSLFRDYPLQSIILTKGKAGATIYLANGDRHHIQPVQNINVLDTVGAGDAFCSILLLGIVADWSLPLTLSRAQEFASAIVGIQGATTKDQSFYHSFLKQWKL